MASIFPTSAASFSRLLARRLAHLVAHLRVVDGRLRPILVLDEPTANLDPETEAGVLEAAYELMPGRATLVIANRLVRMEEADEILVLDRGRIVERGTHERLVNSRGLYQKLFEAQREVLFAS